MVVVVMVRYWWSSVDDVGDVKSDLEKTNSMNSAEINFF